jgi:hypothetical protein
LDEHSGIVCQCCHNPQYQCLICLMIPLFSLSQWFSHRGSDGKISLLRLYPKRILYGLRCLIPPQ